MAASQQPVTYHVDVDAHRQRLAIRMRVDGTAPGTPLRLHIPTWLPGAYAFMRYGRNLVDWNAKDVTTGTALAMKRDGWSGFEVSPAGPSTEITYDAFIQDRAWGELTGTLDHQQAILLGTQYLRVDGNRGPCTVHYAFPRGWSVHHPAGATKKAEHVFEYQSYERMLDTPVVAGRFERITRTFNGTDFHFVFMDRCVGFDEGIEDFLAMSMRVVESTHRMFGAFPFADYTTVLSFSPQAHWGLEHASSTMIAVGEQCFIDRMERMRAIRVFAHELFHAWNVCSLKPAELMQPDFARGSFTDLLWVAEGFTRYYEFLLSTRAGEMSGDDVISNLVHFHQQLCAVPAFKSTSAADNSYASFLNHHRYAGSANTTVDYYDFGMLVAFDLDVALRSAGSSLDEQFSNFYREFVRTGYSQQQLADFLGKTSKDAAAIIEKEVAGRGTLSTAQSLKKLGFNITEETLPYLGITLDKNAGPEITNVFVDGPAARAGIAAQDEIVRVDGFPFALKSLLFLLKNRKSVTLELKRGHTYYSATVEIGRRTQLGKVSWAGTDAQAQVVRKWLGRDDMVLTAGREISLASHENFHGISTIL